MEGAYTVYMDEKRKSWWRLSDEQKEEYRVRYQENKAQFDLEMQGYKTLNVMKFGKVVIPKIWTTFPELDAARVGWEFGSYENTKMEAARFNCLHCNEGVEDNGSSYILKCSEGNVNHYMHKVCIDFYLANKEYLSYLQTCPSCVKLANCEADKIGDDLIPNIFSVYVERYKDIKEHCFKGNNHPRAKCSLCDTMMMTDDKCKKLRCGHYYHSTCLSKYIEGAMNSDMFDICPACSPEVI